MITTKNTTASTVEKGLKEKNKIQGRLTGLTVSYSDSKKKSKNILCMMKIYGHGNEYNYSTLKIVVKEFLRNEGPKNLLL